MWKAYLMVAVFGTLGCWARYGQTLLVQALWGTKFPYATLSINLIGSFLMGFLYIQTLERLTLPPAWRTGILTDFLGGYTTFSTFQMETLLLLENGDVWKGVAYQGLSLGLGLLCVFLGAYIARLL